MGGAAQDIAVPHRKQAHQHGNIPVDRRLAEMPIHIGSAAQKFLEFGGSDRNRQRQADARPDRISAADPIPEAEYASGLDTEFGDLVELRRHRGEMVRHSSASSAALIQARGFRVGHRLLRRVKTSRRR
jgi:hypothetical protein